MAITMQGSWTLTVKSKNAAFAQRFVVSGAATGNGVHDGTPGTTVFVSGAQWSVNIQSQAPGQPWMDSAQRLTFPTTSAGLVKFDILSNDTGADKDYDDLILTCSMPVSASEFVVYGHVKTYAGLCYRNPCFPWYFVIDNYAALLKALEVPDLRRIITKLYPERVPKRPGPGPDPEPLFTPIVLPTGASAVRSGLVFRSAKTGATQTTPKNAKEARKTEEAAVAALKGTAHQATFDAAPLGAGLAALDKADLLALAKISDGLKIFPFCDVEPAPGLLLGFQEYDRTDAEKLGGPYTGTGVRQALGVAATDELGNYIFRFSRSLSDIADEATDVAPGESFATQIFPDLIVQALGTGMSVDWESAPYYNIPNLMRIDLCLPYGRVHPNRGCSGDRVIQRFGDIIVLHSALGGSPNVLDGDGRITCRNANAPQVDCAAWRGGLRLYACFGKPQVTSYTVRYKRIGIDSDFQFMSEAFALNHIPDFAPGYTGTPVGSTLRAVHVDGGPVRTVPTYANHEGDSNWIENDLKLIFSSGYYRPVDQPGSVDFKIQGYDSAGTHVAGTDDLIRLYIDNRPATGDIESITMGATTLGDCALFDLTSANAPLTVRYRVRDPEGFLESWGLSVTRGNNVSLPVDVVGGVILATSGNGAAKVYQPAVPPPNPPPCASFRGTPDEASADIDGYVVTTLQPRGGANWLPADHNFCAFAFTLTANDRTTDGRTAFPLAVFWQDLIGMSFSP